jgi:hypothetical protein
MLPEESALKEEISIGTNYPLNLGWTFSKRTLEG